jgi:hypothetical protein
VVEKQTFFVIVRAAVCLYVAGCAAFGQTGTSQLPLTERLWVATKRFGFILHIAKMSLISISIVPTDNWGSDSFPSDEIQIEI